MLRKIKLDRQQQFDWCSCEKKWHTLFIISLWPFLESFLGWPACLPLTTHPTSSLYFYLGLEKIWMFTHPVLLLSCVTAMPLFMPYADILCLSLKCAAHQWIIANTSFNFIYLFILMIAQSTTWHCKVEGSINSCMWDDLAEFCSIRSRMCGPGVKSHAMVPQLSKSGLWQVYCKRFMLHMFFV